jgi:hypothetical protein
MFLSPVYTLTQLNASPYVDSRLRSDRVEIQTSQWALQMDRLVDAYLEYRSQDPGDGIPIPPPSVPPSEDTPNAALVLSDIELVDMFGKAPFHIQAFPSL